MSHLDEYDSPEFLKDNGLSCESPLKYRPVVQSVTLDVSRYPSLIVIPNGIFDFVAINEEEYLIKRLDNDTDMVLLPRRLLKLACEIEEKFGNGNEYDLTDLLAFIRMNISLDGCLSNQAKKAEFRKTGLSGICTYVAGKLYKVDSVVSKFYRVTDDVQPLKYFKSREHLVKVFAPVPTRRVYVDNPIFDPHVTMAVQHLLPEYIKNPNLIPNEYQFKKLLMQHGRYVDWHEPSWKFFGCQKLMEIMSYSDITDSASEHELLWALATHVLKYSELVKSYANMKNLPMMNGKMRWFCACNKTVAALKDC